MATTDDQPNPPVDDSRPSLAALAETLSKSVVLLSVAVYGCGFLITTVHHASYGFLEGDPLRPRIASAGMWFIFFLSVPILFINLHERFKSSVDATLLPRALRETSNPSTPAVDTWLKRLKPCVNFAAMASYVFLFNWISAGYFFVPILGVDSHDPRPSEMNLVLGLAKVLILGATICFSLFGDRWVKDPRRRIVVALVVLVLFVLRLGAVLYFHRLLLNENWHQLLLPGWFLIIGILWVIYQKIALKSKALGSKMTLLCLVILLLLCFFTVFYYPRIKSSVGGATPVKATVYWSPGLPIVPPVGSGRAPLCADVSLVDESSMGLYVVLPGQERATFIPRASITLVDFGYRPNFLAAGNCDWK